MLPRATRKEADTRKLGSDVRSERDNDVFERTRKPRKKRKKDDSGGVAACATSSCLVPSSSNFVVPESAGMNELQAPLACQIDGNESTVFVMASRDCFLPASAVSISVSPKAIAKNESSRKSKNARRKERHKESQSLLSVEPTPLSAHSLPIDGDSITKPLNKRSSMTQGAPLAEQLAEAITETAGV
jgi:hypothetical protein